MIFVLLGKSASGKDTVFKNINLNKCICTTSRPMRENEIEAKDYFFISEEEFKNRIKSENFIEYRDYKTIKDGVEQTWYYGTEKTNLDITKDNILVLEVNGFKKLKEYFKDENAIGIYLHCKSTIRTKRAKNRGSFCEIEWRRRLQTDREDFEDVFEHVDYVVNSSLELDEVIKEVNSIIEMELETNE